MNSRIIIFLCLLAPMSLGMDRADGELVDEFLEGDYGDDMNRWVAELCDECIAPIEETSVQDTLSNKFNYSYGSAVFADDGSFRGFWPMFALLPRHIQLSHSERSLEGKSRPKNSEKNIRSIEGCPPGVKKCVVPHCNS